MAAGDADEPATRQDPRAGIVSTIPGSAAIGSAMTAAIRGTGLRPKPLSGQPRGLIFVIGGALLALPPGRTRIQGLPTALLVTCFALTPRLGGSSVLARQLELNGGFSFGGLIGTGSSSPASFSACTFALGFFAVILDVMAILVWFEISAAV